MQTLPTRDIHSSARRNSVWLTGALASLVMCVGVGGATAAFTIAQASLPHSAPTPSCDLAGAWDYGPQGATMVHDAVHMAPGTGQWGSNFAYEAPGISERASDAYDVSVEAVGDGLDSAVDAVSDDVGIVFVLAAGAAALALLVVCARAAWLMRERSGGPLETRSVLRAAATAAGAIVVAAMMLRGATSLGAADLADAMSPLTLDARAVIFAACVCALAEWGRRIAARLREPTHD